jgi:hypothetical protein
MGISSKLNEGKIYRFIRTALRMRSLQREQTRGRLCSRKSLKELHDLEIMFDAQLDSIILDVDEVDTERVIRKLSEL